MHTIIRPKQYYKGSWFLNAILVVVVILVIAAVLFPILAHPHKSNKYMCIYQLKEIGIVLNTYLADYGEIPSSYLVNRSEKWNRADFNRFNQLGRLGHNGRAATFSEVLYSTMKDKDQYDFICPSDSSISSDDPAAPSSYAWKIALDKAWYGEGCKKPCRKEADFPYPADQIFLYERKGWHSGGEGLKNDVQINVAFLDSHVKNITIKNATSGDALNCAANSDGEPMYFNYDVKTDKALPEGTPAKWVDPQRYADRF